MTLVVKTWKPDSPIHVVSEKNPALARCGEDLRDYLEVPKGKIDEHPHCQACLEAK